MLVLFLNIRFQPTTKSPSLCVHTITHPAISRPPRSPAFATLHASIPTNAFPDSRYRYQSGKGKRAAAVVSGGLDDQDLKELLGRDLGVAITGTERLGITVVVTEGFGEIGMARRTFELLSTRAGRAASVNGATQIRAGVMRPEILIPVIDGDESQNETNHTESGVLELGTPIRVIRDPYFGMIGTVAALPEAPQVLGSGSKSRVLEVALESGDTVTVPRANVELIET